MDEQRYSDLPPAFEPQPLAQSSIEAVRVRSSFPIGAKGTAAGFNWYRGLPFIKWSPIIAGALIALAAQLLLGLVGMAIGISMVDDATGKIPAGLTASTATFMVLSAAFSTFAGALAASKLSGAIRPQDGMLAGGLSWAFVLVVSVAILGAGMSGFYFRADDANAYFTSPTRMEDLTIAGWATCIAAVLSLATAVLGGLTGTARLRDVGSAIEDIGTSRPAPHRRTARMAEAA